MEWEDHWARALEVGEILCTAMAALRKNFVVRLSVMNMVLVLVALRQIARGSSSEPWSRLWRKKILNAAWTGQRWGLTRSHLKGMTWPLSLFFCFLNFNRRLERFNELNPHQVLLSE